MVGEVWAEIRAGWAEVLLRVAIWVEVSQVAVRIFVAATEVRIVDEGLLAEEVFAWEV